jgi:hypothetical protein
MEAVSPWNPEDKPHFLSDLQTLEPIRRSVVRKKVTIYESPKPPPLRSLKHIEYTLP